MEELKKCPFCNGQAEVRGIKDFSGKVIIASVACKKCEASTRNYAFENAAIEAWNKRVRTSKKINKLKKALIQRKELEMTKLKPCPKCGREIDIEKDMYLPDRDWSPTLYDPDSGGDPISIHCECGIEFCAGTHDWEEFASAWNDRV